MANGDPKTYQDGYADGYRQGLVDGRHPIQPLTPFQPLRPLQPYVPYEASLCPKCGLNFSGAMGYVCPQVTCPIQPKATC
jgi:hypothetical protein